MWTEAGWRGSCCVWCQLCPLLLPKGRLKTQTGVGEEETWGEREREPQRAGRTTLPSTVQVPGHVLGHLGGPPPGNLKDRIEFQGGSESRAGALLSQGTEIKHQLLC